MTLRRFLLCAALLLLAFALLLVWRFAALVGDPAVVAREVEARMLAATGYAVAIGGGAHVERMPLALRLDDVLCTPDSSLRVALRSVRLVPSLRMLLTGELRLARVDVQGAFVSVTLPGGGGAEPSRLAAEARLAGRVSLQPQIGSVGGELPPGVLSRSHASGGGVAGHTGGESVGQAGEQPRGELVGQMGGQAGGEAQSASTIDSPLAGVASLYGMRINVQDATLAVRKGDGPLVQVRGLAAQLHMASDSTGTAGLQWDRLAVGSGPDALLMEHGNVQATGVRVAAQGSTAQLVLTTATTLPDGWGRLGVHLAGALEVDAQGVARLAQGRLATDGTVNLRGHATPLALDIPFQNLTADGAMLHGAHVRLDGDSGSVDARLHGMAQGQPALEGTVHLTHLSLPRWFGFGRILPAGVQHALDGLSGSLDFTLTTQSLVVPRLEARVLGVPLQGDGGVDSFATPVIRIAAKAESLDVNTVLPELMGKPPAPPVYAQPVAVPLGGSAEASALAIPDVGYDISIRAAAADVWRFGVQQLAFRCTPSQRGTLLTFDSPSVYGGSVTARLDIADDYRLEAVLNAIQTQQPAAIIAGRNVLAGLLRAKMDVRGKGSTLAGVLATLSGTLDGSIDNGALLLRRNGQNEKLLFSRCDVKAQAKGPGLGNGQTVPARLAWMGQWNMALRGTAGEATLQMQGPLQFSTATLLPVAADGIAAQLALRLNESATGLRRGVDATISGPLAFDAQAATFGFREATGEVMGLAVRGSVMGSRLMDAMEWTADATVSGAAIPLLDRCGIRLWERADPSLPSHFEASASVVMTPARLAVRDLKLASGGTSVAGWVSRDAGVRPLWRFGLRADTLDADRYLPPVREEVLASTEPLQVNWLRDFNAEGEVSVDALRLRKFWYRKLKVPVSLRDGTLEAIPVVGGLYGGNLTASLRAAVQDGLDVRFRYDARNCDLQPAVDDRLGRALLGGKADLAFDVRGMVRSAADIPANLDGTWNFEVRDGFYSGSAKPGAGVPAEGRLPFSVARASGFMRQGILYNEDFALRSLLLTMTGKGWVDVARNTLDYTANMALVRVPNIPIRYHGSLSRPESSVQQLDILTGTIGNIGGGVFGLVEGVLTSPLRVLEALGGPAKPALEGATGSGKPAAEGTNAPAKPR